MFPVTEPRGGTIGALRSTFEHAAVGVAHVALDGRFLRVNRKLCDILGYKNEELLQKRFQELTYGDDLATDLELLRRAVGGEIATFAMEKRYIRGNGEIIWADLSVSIVRDAADRPQYCVSIITDITPRKRIEDALRESEQRLGLALDAGKLGSWSLDLTSESFEISDHGKALFGLLPGAALTYGTLLSMIHPADVEAKVAAVQQSVTSGNDYEFELRTIWPDGSLHWMMARGRPIYDGEGRPLRMVGVFLDTTERNQAREELEQRNDTLEAHYAAIFQHTTAGLILFSVTKDDRFVYDAVNPAHEKATGRTAAELIGKTAYDLFPRELSDRLYERYRRCRDTRTPITYEDTYPYPAGTQIVQATVVPIVNGEGQV